MAGHTTRMWEAITGTGLSDLTGQTIVEFWLWFRTFLNVARR